MITKSFSFEIKSVDEQGRFAGRAACYGNTDSDNEVIDPGCFKRSVQNSQGRVPILWSHDPKTPIGWGVSAKESADSLWVEGQLMLNTQHGRLAYEYAKLGQSIGAANIGLSVGFRPVKDGVYVKDGQRHWKECQLLEYSYAVFPSNPEAGVTGVKSESILPLIIKSEDLGEQSDPDLSDEQKISLDNLSTIIKADQDQVVDSNSKSKEPPVAQTNNKEAAPGLLTFEAALTQQKSEDPERLRIEKALHDSMASIMESATSKGDQKVLVHKSWHAYADAVSDLCAKSLDAVDDLLGKVLAIKGMNTSSHVEAQSKLAKAKVHMDESSAQRESADQHSKKAHRYMSEAIQAYSAADIQAPNGSATGATGKKADEQDSTTKAEAAVLDLSALLSALTVK